MKSVDEIKLHIEHLLKEADLVSWKNGGDRFDHGNVIAYNWLCNELRKLLKEENK